MTDIQSQLAQLMGCPGALSDRAGQAVQYKELLGRNEITLAEYQDLVQDLARLDNIELNAQELDHKILLYEVLQALKNIPLP